MSDNIVTSRHHKVMVRGILSVFFVKEEVLEIISMKEWTTYYCHTQKAQAIGDGAPTIIGNINGFIVHCKKDKLFPKFMSYNFVK